MKFDKKIKLNMKRKIVKNYIRNNPNCTYLDIRRDTKIKVERVYNNMKEAYKDAKVKLSKNLTKRNKEKQKKDVVEFIKKHPSCTVTEIQNRTKVNVPRRFGSIIQAYKAAGVEYPEKKITSGVMNPHVVRRCKEFEKRVIMLLKNLGEVKPKVRTYAGIINCLFKYKDAIYVVEIKDFRGNNNITMYELNQLIRYMEGLDCKNGLLICPKESFPKRKNSRNIYIDSLKLKILSEEDLRGRSINHYL